MKILFKTLSLSLFGFLLILINPANSHAEIVSESAPYIDVAENVSVINYIDGDAWVIGNDVVVSERIDGDFFAVGKKIAINSPITGSVRIVGEQLIINSEISGSLFFVGSTMYITPQGKIENDVYGISQRFNHEGTINKNLNLKYSENSNIRIKGSILQNLWLTEDSKLDKDPSAVILGETKFFNMKNNSSASESKNNSYKWPNIFSIISLFVIAVFILKYHPTLFDKAYTTYISEYKNFMIKGFLTLVLYPFIFLILLISIFGISIALISSALLFIAFYIAPIFPAIYIAKKLFSNKEFTLIHLFIGIIIFEIILVIPFVGFIAYLLSAIPLIGLLTNLIFKKK